VNTARLISDNRTAQLNAWLRESGELLVEVFPPLRFFRNIEPHRFGVAFFVRSAADIEEIIAAELELRVLQSKKIGLSLRVYRRSQYPLQGIAGPALIERVIGTVPDGEFYDIVSLDHRYPPFPIVWLSNAGGHVELQHELAKLAGKQVAIGKTWRDDKAMEFVPNPEEIAIWSYKRKGEQYEFVD
jgi:hypothetical protein